MAPTGAEADKFAVPALPVTLNELAVTAKECEAAGSAVIHVHIRDDDLGQVAALRRLLAEFGPPAGGHVHCDLVMGVPGDVATLAAVAALPAGATWPATGIGRTTLPVMFGALGAGGHLRVGMEDTLTFARGRPVARNAELVERAVGLARLAQRPSMPPSRPAPSSASPPPQLTTPAPADNARPAKPAAANPPAAARRRARWWLWQPAR